MEFELSIDPAKFRATNAAWNTLMLNDPWSVGYVSTLIESQSFQNKEDWERFYYNSGKKRNELLKAVTPPVFYALEKEQVIRVGKQAARKLDWHIRNLNTGYGRTKEQLTAKGEILSEFLRSKRIQLTKNEAFECVRFRVIGETWNGILVRERNTVHKLSALFPTTEFRKVSGEIDHRYAIDYELYHHGKLTAGIQIKPNSYNGKAAYILKAKRANKIKNAHFFAAFAVEVIDILADTKGNISNPEGLQKIKQLLRN